MRKNNEEDQICMALTNRFHLQHRKAWELFFHIPNGGKRGKREAGIFKAMGVKPGVSDYMLMMPWAHFHGLWLEVKTGTGSCSPDQRDFLKLARSQGYAAMVGFGLDECWFILDNWAKGQGWELGDAGPQGVDYFATYTPARSKVL